MVLIVDQASLIEFVERAAGQRSDLVLLPQSAVDAKDVSCTTSALTGIASANECHIVYKLIANKRASRD